MGNYKMILSLLFAVLFMLVFAGCNNDAKELQGATEQTAGSEFEANSITASENDATGSTEVFYTEADDLEIMTAPAPESNSQKTTEPKTTAPVPEKTEVYEPATEQSADTQTTRIELPFVPAGE